MTIKTKSPAWLLPSVSTLSRAPSVRDRRLLFNAAGFGLLNRVRDHSAADPPAELIDSALWSACHGGQQATPEDWVPLKSLGDWPMTFPGGRDPSEVTIRI